MGRKIPGRKHRGIKDPEKQRQERLKSIKNKINAPPTNPDDQQVPKSLLRLIDLQTKVKNRDFKKKKIKRPQQFEQQPNESDREFLNRVNRHCAIVKHEAAFENKFNVEIKKNAEGEVEEVKKRPKDPIQLMLKEAKQKKKKKKKADGDQPRLTKSQKRSLKLKEKKTKKLGANFDGFKNLKDEVKFGEQVHAPPSLTVPKKIQSNAGGAPRPGKKDLLLNTLLPKSKIIDKKAKRKELPNALRRQLDQQQQEVIEAYRVLKGKKRGAL